MTTNTSPSSIRIGDGERDAATTCLAAHFAAGRLTREEFDERAGLALAAHTDGELAALFADLPRPVAAEGQQLVARPAGDTERAHRAWLRHRVAPWMLVMAVVLSVWAPSGQGGPWSVYLAMFLGLGVLADRRRGPRRARAAVRR